MPKQYRRICIQRCGYAVVPGDTDDEAIENARNLTESDFDWEPVNPSMIETEAEIIEVCGENGAEIKED